MNILFLIKHPAVFNSVKSIFEAAKRNKNINPKLVVIDENYEVFDFAKNIDKNAIWAFNPNNKKYLDLKQLNPDYIFLSQPYYGDYPREYKFDKLYQIAKLCYVPYGFILQYGFTKTAIPQEMFRYTSFLFADNKYTYQGMLNRYDDIKDIHYKKYVFDIGYPRFDEWFSLLSNYNNDNHKKDRKILYIPRHVRTDNPDVGASSFLKFKDDILDYALRNDSDSIILRPHQKLFYSLKIRNIMTEKDIISYQEKVSSIKNVCFDNAKTFSYTQSFLDADILLADFSSTLIEFFISKKPIIFIGNEKFIPEYEQLFSSFYRVNRNWAEVEKVLNDLKRGIDPKSEEREIAVSNFIKNYNKNIGEKIINILVEHYNNQHTLVPIVRRRQLSTCDNRIHIYYFWESNSPMPAYLQLCIDTWKKFIHNADFIHINHNNWNEYLGDDYDLEKLKTFSLPQQANAVAAAILAKKGGIFFHVDTIVTKNIYKFIDFAPNKLVHFGYSNYREGHLGILKTAAENPLVIYWRDECKRRIENKSEVVGWGYLGNEILNLAEKQEKFFKNYSILDKLDFGILLEDICIEGLSEENSKYENFYFDENIDISPSRLLDKYVKLGLIYLHNSRTPQFIKDITDKVQFLNTKCVMSDILNYLLTC